MNEIAAKKKCGMVGVWSVAMLSGAVALAEPSGDRPDATHAYAVHDENRPYPEKVEAVPGLPPSDAIVLFDGTQESIDRNWRDAKGDKTKWKLQDGAFVCVPKSGPAVSAEEFGDCQIHVEWKLPEDDPNGRGNSGVYAMGFYEIQIMDSTALVPTRSPWIHGNYADGQAGAIYGQHPALVNPCRKPGEWQSFDIVFHPPWRKNGKIVEPATLTVFLNGVLVQDNFEPEGRTAWCRRASEQPEKSVGPVKLQDHGHPVPFRNIWVRKILPRHADTLSGGRYANPEEVAKVRHRLAAESLAFADETDDPVEKFIRLWESYCYEPNPDLSGKLDVAAAACVAAIRANDERATSLNRFYALKRFVKMLVASGWMKKESELEKLIDGWTPPPKPKAVHLRDI